MMYYVVRCVFEHGAELPSLSVQCGTVAISCRIYRLLRLTEHYSFLQTLHVSMENYHHQAFCYKILIVKANGLYLRDLLNVTTYLLLPGAELPS
jgi:hypothetical protein